MVAKLSESKKELLNLVSVLLKSTSFQKYVSSSEISSFIEDNLLYWDLDHDQGFAVIDIKNQVIYHVFETDSAKEPLSNNSLCDSVTAQLVLEDIRRALIIGGVDISKNVDQRLYAAPDQSNARSHISHHSR